MSDRPDLMILGASTRAAAFSAIRAGMRPCCLDLFADADLSAVCPTHPLDSFEDGDRIARAAEGFGARSWLYAGPIENHPALVVRLQRSGRLLGVGPDALRAVRDPWKTAEAFARAGLATPRLARAAEGPPERGVWLRKPFASAGGRSIAIADGPTLGGDAFSYYQEFIDGPTISALYAAAGGRSRLLGVARQFHGAPGAPFLYRGGIAPWDVADAVRAKIRRTGEALASVFPLVGLFGVDFILRGDEPLPIEVNPRYTASVELHELTMQRALMLDHVLACEDRQLPDGEMARPSDRYVGKRVLYAGRRLVAPRIAAPERSADPFAAPEAADIPHPGTIIGPLEPILTVFATASTFEACEDRLNRIEHNWMRRFD